MKINRFIHYLEEYIEIEKLDDINKEEARRLLIWRRAFMADAIEFLNNENSNLTEDEKETLVKYRRKMTLSLKEDSEVGCRKCGYGGKWKVYSNGKVVTRAVCNNCGHAVDFPVKEFKEHSDLQVYNLRMFT